MRDIEELKEIARQCRKDVLKMTMKAKEGHIATSFSAMDILSALYFSAIKVDPKNPKWDDRDRFIMSKGHGAYAIYAILARKGFFLVSELDTIDKVGTAFGGHPDMKKVSGIELSTGSLGHGLSISAGMAIAAKNDKRDYRIFTLMGDGECQEGSVWEAAMFASSRNLDNLIGIVDFNGLQAIGTTENVLTLSPFAQKWNAFGWAVREVNGHDYNELLKTFIELPFEMGKPSMIVAKTVKGKGVSFMENQISWHARVTTDEEYKKAVKEIEQYS